MIQDTSIGLPVCPFKPGDLVRLKGSSVKMVVQQVSPSPQTVSWTLTVFWLNTNAEVQQALFPHHILELAT